MSADEFVRTGVADFIAVQNPEATVTLSMSVRQSQWLGTQLCAEIGDILATANEPKRAILTDLLWKFVRGDNHGVMDCAADLRELHL